MFKTYLNTLKKSIRYAAIALGIWLIGGVLVYVVAAFFFENLPSVSSFIILGTAPAVLFFVSLDARKEVWDSKISQKEKAPSVGQEIKGILLSKQYWSEILVCCTYIAALCLVAREFIFDPTVWPDMRFYLLGGFLIFAALDLLSWVLVRVFLRNK